MKAITTAVKHISETSSSRSLNEDMLTKVLRAIPGIENSPLLAILQNQDKLQQQSAAATKTGQSRIKFVGASTSRPQLTGSQAIADLLPAAAGALSKL